MSTEIKHIHHIGHVVSNMSAALELYKKLGFDYLTPAYPLLAEKEGEEPKPLGVANTHITFLRNFVEIATVVKEGSVIPEDAKMVPIQVPSEALPLVLQNIKRTVETVSNCLERFEGTHILCFYSQDLEGSAARFNKNGTGHSGVNPVQRPIETTEGIKIMPLKVLEIDRENVPEGRLAIADIPPLEILQAQTHMNHPNGATELIEVILCVAAIEIEDFTKRYQRYLNCDAIVDGAIRVFNLENARITIVPETHLNSILPDEAVPDLPGFAGYVVEVTDVTVTRKYIESNGFQVKETPEGDIFVPSREAFGTALVFRQTR